MNRLTSFAAAGAALLAPLALVLTPMLARGAHAADMVVVPPPAIDETGSHAAETVVLAGGCFWGVQGVFQHVKGVTSATSGYTGGAQRDAVYETVSGGDTGHAESVRVVFDPRVVSLGKLLRIYFSVAHDPTELDRQGPDSGSQYRSTIFPQTAEQARVASAYVAQLDRAHVFPSRIVTTIEPGRVFYPAEAHHQNFLTLNPDYPYIAINDMPKVAALKTDFPSEYREAPVLVNAALPGS